MRTEVRFLLAIALMIGVLVGTNVLFPPVVPEEEPVAPVPAGETAEEPGEPAVPEPERPGGVEPEAAATGQDTAAADELVLPPEIGETEPEQVVAPGPEAPASEAPDRRATVETPLYRFTFGSRGARLVEAELPGFESFTRDGPVQLVHPEVDGILATRLLVGEDTLDLRTLPFEVEPAGGFTLEQGDQARTLTFRYAPPERAFAYEVAYTFRPDAYVVDVDHRFTGVERGLLLVDLGPGLAPNEHDSEEEARTMAFVGNHLQEGIVSTALREVESFQVEDGPFLWAAIRSKYFVLAVLAGPEEGSSTYLGGILAWPGTEDRPADVAVTQPLTAQGQVAYRLFAGPQEYARLAAIASDLEEVNPYGWRFLRPILRPIVAATIWVLTFLHENLNWGYGWVLILFGVMMRVVFFPFYHKAMKAQLKNMEVQPLLKDIQTRYKDDPEKMQKELMKLYREHGFNPLAGCLPMLLPWPILISLFFVFQNTIELRGVSFLWLPDLSAADPYYILPAILGASMFLLQWVGYRSMEEANPQMKMMMWIMPIFMVFIFFNLASGLNLYYATANLATLPQQFWIAGERKKAKARAPTPSTTTN